jgi:hypothetical protein
MKSLCDGRAGTGSPFLTCKLAKAFWFSSNLKITGLKAPFITDFICHKPLQYGVFVVEQRRRAEDGS